MIMKFGGTSVGSVVNMKKVAHLISNEKRRKIVVLSAMSGTTNSLLEICRFIHENDKKSALALITELENKYNQVCVELFAAENLDEIKSVLTERFNYIKSYCEDVFTFHEEKVIIAQGEIITNILFNFYMSLNHANPIFIDALDCMRLNQDLEPDTGFIDKQLNDILDNNSSANLFITQGFICRNSFGQIDNLKRGGSDYTASIMGAAIQAEEIQIWTDIDGMHNNDPRIVNNTKPIAKLSYDEAAELAYFGAKILHPSSVIPAKNKNIPVRLLNTMKPKSEGTFISVEKSAAHIKAIAAKSGITVINIQSSRMFLAYGFLRKVFEIFERFKTSIDLITTSEVAISVTIDDLSELEQIKNELQHIGKIKIEHNQTIICIVGDLIAENSGIATKIFNALAPIPLRMISYGGSQNNISVLIDTNYKTQTLNLLNQHLFQLS